MKISTKYDESHILDKEADPVLEDEIGSENFNKAIDDMIELCKEYNGLGLAANQIFLQKRVFVYLKENGEYDVVINPVVKVKKDMVTHHNEGCLSVPGQFYDVKRYKTMVIEGVDRSGKKRLLKAPNKRTAFIWQHEIDHLNGVLISEKGIKKKI